MIKRFVTIFVLLLALAMPAFGGHVKPSGVYCDGGCSGGACAVCGADCGVILMSASTIDEGEIKDTSSASPQGDELSSLFVFALALFMAYRMRL